MKRIVLIVILVGVLGSWTLPGKPVKHETGAPADMKGDFTDDYGIRYTITDTLWTQHPRTRFHIIRWNAAGKYLVARNDAANPGDANLYTRIDFMAFDAMDPWKWGYCLTAYNAKNDSIAEAAAAADRKNPKKGCNGFPFSRMKKAG